MKDVQPRLVADGFLILEAPRWHDGHVWVTDVFDRCIYRVGPDGTSEKILADVPANPNSIGFQADGGVLVVSSVDRRILRHHDGGTSVFVDLSALATGDVNDFLIDPEGRVYVGNFGYDSLGGEAPRDTSIHLVHPDGRIDVAATDLEFPNGMALIDQGRTLVVAETWQGRLTAFERHADGTLGRRDTFAELPGRHPDGICADIDDAIWAPCFNTGEVLRVVRGGDITHRIRLPGRAIACQVGGAGGRELFCTGYDGTIEQCLAGERTGALYSVDLTVV